MCDLIEAADAALKDLFDSDTGMQAMVLNYPGAREAVLGSLKRRVQASFDPKVGKLDFPQAIKVIDEAQAIPSLADSSSLRDLRQQLESAQEQEINRNAELYEQLLVDREAEQLL